jgi:hypothetical protein
MLHSIILLIAVLGTAHAQDDSATPTTTTVSPDELPSAKPPVNPAKTSATKQDGEDNNDDEVENQDNSTADLNRDAYTAYRSTLTEEDKEDGERGYESHRGKRTYTVHLLPDGSPMFSIPTDISERDSVRFVVWARESEAKEYTVKTAGCEKTDLQRFNGAQEDDVAAQAKEPIVSQDLGVLLSCGEGSVDVTVKGPEITAGSGEVDHTFKVAFAATYTMSAAVGLFYDASPTNALELTPGEAAEDGTAQFKLGRSNAQLGLQRTGLLMMHPFGYTPGRMRPGSSLVNPTLGISLSEKIFTEAYIGNSFAIPGVQGFWVTAGYHMQQIERPTAASGVKVGEMTSLSAPSAIATENVWTGPFKNGGFYIGLSFDVATFSRLTKQQQPEEQEEQEEQEGA